jgi:hypothetical protein
MQPTEKEQKNPLFRIDYDGRWFHDGDEIKRPALAKLFADKGLRVDEQGQHWLSSPESRYPVTVEDVPFIIVDYDIKEDGIDLTGNMGDVVLLGPDHVLELRAEPRGGVVVPYVNVRAGLYARMSRAVFYKLVEHATPDHDKMILNSRGICHILGHVPQDNH